MVNALVAVVILAASNDAPVSAKCRPLFRKAEVEMVQQLSAVELEKGLPEQRVGEWFEQSFGQDAVVCWEANDCGEQTGDPEVDHARDIPLCVEAWAMLPRGTVYGFAVAIGTHSKGAYGVPSVRSVYLRKGDEVKQLDSLRELVNQAEGD